MTSRPPAHRSEPVLWWELINEADDITARYKLGLASVWKWIHESDYPRARRQLNAIKDAIEKTQGGTLP